MPSDRLLRIAKKAFLVFVIAALAVGVFARTYNLSLPKVQVFDEVYFPVFAEKFLHGELAFDAHPTLGKLLIVPGIAAFGNEQFGWRVIVCLFGLAFIGLMAWGAKRKGADRTEILIVASLAALSGMLVTYSRVGLIDGILAFFTFLAFFYSLRAEKKWHFLVLGLLIGLAVSVKWIAIGIIAPIGYLAWRRKHLWEFIVALALAGVTYLGIETFARIITGSEHIWADIREWNWQAWNYHRTLTATHPWSSQWWSWPLMLRPVLMYYQTNAQGMQEVITNLDNPLLWWSSTVAVILSIIRVVKLALTEEKKSVALTLGFVFALALLVNQVLIRNFQGILLGLFVLASLTVYVLRGREGMDRVKAEVFDHPLVPLLIGYFAFFVPWMFIGRVVFIYHYLPSLIFAFLMLGYWLHEWYRRSPVWCVAFLFVIFATTVFYLPLNMGLPIPKGFEELHFPIKSWL